MFGYRILKPLKFLPFISTEKTSDCPSALTSNRKVNRRELETLRGVQARERTRAPHIPASAAPAEARQPASAGVAKIFCLARGKILERCVMSEEKRNTAAQIGTLSSCLIEGDPEQKVRER